MLIKALCDYSDKIANKSENTVPKGFSAQNVHFEILLSPDGRITDIIDICNEKEIPQKNGKKKSVSVPEQINLPERSQKTSICSNIIEHRPLYIFGLSLDKEHDIFTTTDKTGKAEKSHKAFCETNAEFFKDLDSQICKAYYNFINNWKPENETENSHILKLKKSYGNSYFSFGLDGNPDIRLEEDEQFKKKYSEYFESLNDDTDENSDTGNMCAILGDLLPTARIHDKIKFPGGNSTGCVLVGMKESAYESYGKTQSYNSNISEQAMKKYTATLNKLLSDKQHHIILDDMVIVFFAMKKDDSSECDIFSSLFGFENFSDNSVQKENELSAIFNKLRSGASANISNVDIDDDVTFCICGMTPNSSRISQKFFYRDKFGKLIENVIQHQKDMQVKEEMKQIYFSYIKKELVSPKSSNSKVSPPLMTSIMLAALNGTAYPNGLLENAVRRVKTDNDEENNHFIKINDTRIGIIKACLNRKSRLSNNKEEIKMSLDTNNTNPAYLCGRLFAVLEKAQQDASGGNLNKTIKDSYFSSACSKPSAVFPKLIQLSQNHIRKLNDGSERYYQKLIGDICDGMQGAFPQTLDLDSQGSFIIGYYQQNRSLYTKNEKISAGDEE